MENIDEKLKTLGFKRFGNEWTRIDEGGHHKHVVFFSRSWDCWIVERHKRQPNGSFKMKGKDWMEYVYAEDMLGALE